MTSNQSEKISTYQQYLPAILQEEIFLGQFLLAFERILSGHNGRPDPREIITNETENPPGLEQIINNIDIFFNPQQTPKEFLPWLAGWVALSLREDWTEEVKREFIQKIVEHYRWRGTKKGLEEILSTYLEASGFPKDVDIFDQFADFPNYFQVQLTLNDRDPDKYWRQAKIAQAIIDSEKPAQTYYGLMILVPTMQITTIPDASQDDFPFTLPNDPDPIEEIKLKAIITITQPTQNTEELLNKIYVRIKDNVSDFHLLTPETIKESNQITVRRTISDQYLLQNITELSVTIKNINEEEITGEVTVTVEEINHEESTQTLLDSQGFTLRAIPDEKILQIVRKDGENYTCDDPKIPTYLGTTTQPLN